MSAWAVQSARAHREAVETGIPASVRVLQVALGTELVAFMAGVDRKTVAKWAAGSARPRRESEERIRLAYQVFRLLLERDSEHTVRAWFIGLNPQLNDVAPARALSDGQLKEVLVAAKSFIRGG